MDFRNLDSCNAGIACNSIKAVVISSTGIHRERKDMDHCAGRKDESNLALRSAWPLGPVPAVHCSMF